MNIDGRPELRVGLDAKIFREFYYLKEELENFCRKNNLQTTGGKLELTERIACFLETGEKPQRNQPARKTNRFEVITLESVIEENIVCSEKHRAFYKGQIGKSFSFNVEFQKWLKTNAGKTYRDSVDAYYSILANKKKNPSKINKQFEYNTYIRDFFADNKDKNLQQAIECWRYKKSQRGSNKYERGDLKILG